jgi:hypothetical protein
MLFMRVYEHAVDIDTYAVTLDMVWVWYNIETGTTSYDHPIMTPSPSRLRPQFTLTFLQELPDGILDSWIHK